MTWEDIVKQKQDEEPAATFNDDDYHMLQFLVKGAIEHLENFSLPEDIDLDEPIKDLKKLHQILTGDYSEHHLH